MSEPNSFINPAAVNAEAGIIGAALNGSKVIASLAPDDFYDPRHEMIATAILGMLRRDVPVDPLTVAAELDKVGLLRRAGGALALSQLAGDAPVGPSAPYYAEIVRNDRIRRYRHDCAVRLAEMTNTPAAVEDLPEIEARHLADLAGCPPPLDGGDLWDPQRYSARTIRYRLDKPDDWLTPGLIARLDRVMVTGVEGVSKSTVLRQVGGCVAAGLNPWNGARVADGHRTLILDCENTDRQITNGTRWLGARIEHRMYTRGWDERLHIVDRSEGINLLGRDVPFLRKLVESFRPDLLILGPMYKLMRGDPNKDSDVLEVLSVLDEIRVKHDLALIIEAHSPLAQGGNERPVRPFGSSVQLRWPEIGFGLRPDVRPEVQEDRTESDMRHGRISYMELAPWRGQRERRDWPSHIRYGDTNQLPWVPTAESWRPSVDAEYTEQPELGEAM